MNEPRMDVSVFKKMRDEISEACRGIRATRNNKRMQMLHEAITGIFSVNRVESNDYWREVAFRSGQGGKFGGT